VSFTIIQAGSTLQFVDDTGAISTLSLPTGVTLRTDVPPRFIVHKGFVVLVNTPSTPLTIDYTGTIRPLTPKAPSVAPIVSAGDAGSLSGTYGGIRDTFVIEDVNGHVIAESDYSPPSNTVTIAGKMLKVTNIETSSEPISSRRIYRPTTNGAILFPWLDVDGNVITEVEDDLADAGLSILAAPLLGNPPRLTLIAEWRDRLWGVGDIDLDDLYFSRPDAPWSWPSTYFLAVPGSGRDNLGIRSLMPRREALGVARRDVVFQVTGEDIDDFRLVKLSENTGVESNESVVVYRDAVFWLWKDGVYQWDSDGLQNISDPNVSTWFNSSSYFNQDMFKYAFAVFDPKRYKYRLYLASAGSNVIDRWVEYDINYKTWWGPHKTGAFSPTSAFFLVDGNDKTNAIAGSSSGYIWEEQATPTDGTSTGIDFDVDTRFYDFGVPDYQKYCGQISMIGKVQSAGTITITPKTGYLDASIQAPIFYDMTKGRQRLRRLGTGKVAQLNFKHTAAGEPIEIYGFNFPYNILGRR
jgi:hypothetical protein